MGKLSKEEQEAIDAFVNENSADDVELFDRRLYQALGEHELIFKGVEPRPMEKSKKNKALNASLIYTFQDATNPNRELSHRVFNNHERVWKQENLDIWSAFLPGAAVDMAIHFDATMKKLLVAHASGEATPLTGRHAKVKVYKGEPNEDGFSFTEFEWSPVEDQDGEAPF